MKKIKNISKKRKKVSKLYRQENLLNEGFYEKQFRNYLTNYRYIPQKVFFYNHYDFFIADFYLPDYNIVIEIDGKQHELDKEYDSYRTNILKSLGVRKVLRFKNSDFKTISPQRIREILLVNLVA